MEIISGKALGHRECQEVTEANFAEAKKQAEDLRVFLDDNNGSFKHIFSHAHALHACQVYDDEQPFNFFVVGKHLTDRTDNPKKKLNDENYYFPARVIYNPRIKTSLMTYLDKVDQVQKGTGRVIDTRMKAVNNVIRVGEACMSYPNRDERKMDRFYYVTVSYQIEENGKLVDREEKIHGLKSHIFQHETDHAQGIDIAHGKGDGRIPIEERVMENYVTLEEYEEQEREWVERIKKVNTHAVVEKVDTGEICLLSLDEILPDGFAEGGLHYYNEDGTIKEEFAKSDVIVGEKYEQREDTQAPEEEAKAEAETEGEARDTN